ncbi:MAG: hypothetical protein CVV61_00500 [Tenericutes bacterium HGW-Tenericutes-6]|jgi:sugar diacid utilization regulator|nr:MAG: hypothetical protein CVV61_00500 [Tenericutes bacterium HGW-Tenericutes-6]
MYRYLIIESKHDINQDLQVILSMFSDFIHIESYSSDQHALCIYYNHDTDIPFKDIMLNMMSDILSDLRIYVSYRFDQKDALESHQKSIKTLLKDIPFTKYVYLDDKVLLLALGTTHQSILKPLILRKYKSDQMMIDTIKTYLETDQNMSSASKILYVHRNTLIQRIDKFEQVTGFDVKIFIDAYLIYHLIR